MAPIGSNAFAVLLWGAVLGVLFVFCYEVYALAGDLGWYDAQ